MKFGKIARNITLLLLCSITVAAYQNCGAPSNRFNDHELSEAASFLDYPYSAAPKFYGDFVILREAARAESLSEFKFIGSAAYIADSTQPVSYTVVVENSDGTRVCPFQSGQLPVGTTAFEFQCITSVPSTSLKVILTLAAGTVEQTLQRVY